MNRSESLKELTAAMVKVQSVLRHASKDSQNSHLKNRYADLASVWDACREPLTANGLAILQPASAVGKAVTVETTLLHSSGEWVAETLTLDARDSSPQSVGSAITYGRRYGLSAMVGICPDDDDGEGATDHTGAAHRPAAAPRPRPNLPPRPRPDAERDVAPAAAPVKHDDRPFSTLVQDELDRRHKAFREDHPDAKDVLNIFEANRHLLKTAVFEKRTGDPGPKATDGKVRQILGELYRKPELYTPMRKELAAYLTAKFAEAHERAIQEEQGDPDLDEVKAESAAQAIEREPGEEG